MSHLTGHGPPHLRPPVDPALAARCTRLLAPLFPQVDLHGVGVLVAHDGTSWEVWAFDAHDAPVERITRVEPDLAETPDAALSLLIERTRVRARAMADALAADDASLAAGRGN